MARPNDPAFTKYRSQQKLSSDESDRDDQGKQLKLRTEQNTRYNKNLQALSLATARVSHPAYNMIPSPHKNMYIHNINKNSVDRPILSPAKGLGRSGQNTMTHMPSSSHLDQDEEQIEDFHQSSNKRGPGQSISDHPISGGNGSLRVVDPIFPTSTSYSGRRSSIGNVDDRPRSARQDDDCSPGQHGRGQQKPNGLLGMSNQFGRDEVYNPSSQSNYIHPPEMQDDVSPHTDLMASMLLQQRLTNEAIQGLAHAVKGSLTDPTRSSSNIFLPGVSNFNGDINACATTFLKELNEAFTLDRIPSDFRMCLLRKKLRGDTLSWFEALTDREGDMHYEVFCQKFLQTFGRFKRDKRENHLSKFINMRREEGESYSKFIAKLKLEAYLGQVDDEALIVNVALSHLPADLRFPLEVAGMTKSIIQIEAMLKQYDDSVKTQHKGRPSPRESKVPHKSQPYNAVSSHPSHNQPQSQPPYNQPQPPFMPPPQPPTSLPQHFYPPPPMPYPPPPMQFNKTPQYNFVPRAPQGPRRVVLGDRFFNVPHGEICEDPEVKGCRLWVNIPEMGRRFCSTCGFIADNPSDFRAHLLCSFGNGCTHCLSKFHRDAACFKFKREQHRPPLAGPSSASD